MRLPEVSKTVQVPDNVTLSIEGKKINVKGAKGTLTRDFSFAPISIEGEGKNVRISGKMATQKGSCSRRNDLLTHTKHDYWRNKGLSIQT